MTEPEIPNGYRALGSGPIGRHLILRTDTLFLIPILGTGGIGFPGVPRPYGGFVTLPVMALSLAMPVPASRPLRLALFAVVGIVGLALLVRRFPSVTWPFLLVLWSLVRLGHEGLVGPTRFGRFLNRPLGRRTDETPTPR